MRFTAELANAKNLLEKARFSERHSLHRATIMYCVLAIESFWWAVRFGKADVLESYLTSSRGKKWLSKAQEEGLVTAAEARTVNAIYSVRDAHLHWNPHMKTVKGYGEALREFGLDIAVLAKDFQHIASPPVAGAVLSGTERLFRAWMTRLFS